MSKAEIIVAQNGGIHGSPVGPLLHAAGYRVMTSAALGRSPAPPSGTDTNPNSGRLK